MKHLFGQIHCNARKVGASLTITGLQISLKQTGILNFSQTHQRYFFSTMSFRQKEKHDELMNGIDNILTVRGNSIYCMHFHYQLTCINVDLAQIRATQMRVAVSGPGSRWFSGLQILSRGESLPALPAICFDSCDKMCGKEPTSTKACYAPTSPARLQSVPRTFRPRQSPKKRFCFERKFRVHVICHTTFNPRVPVMKMAKSCKHCELQTL